MHARIVPWSGIGNEWHGFGMHGSTLTYNTLASATCKLYCGTTVYESMTHATTTLNSKVTCGTNS